MSLNFFGPRVIMAWTFVMCFSLVPQLGMGQAIIGYKPVPIHISNQFTLPTAPIIKAYWMALDSLSKVYKIPIDTQRTYKYTYALSSTIDYTPTESYDDLFQFQETIVLQDLTGHREIINVVSKYKNLPDLSQYPNKMRAVFAHNYAYLFNLLAGYGNPSTNSLISKPALRIIFDEHSTNPTQLNIQKVIQDTFEKNQGRLEYQLVNTELTKSIGAIRDIHIKIANYPLDKTIHVNWVFDSQANTFYNGKPITTDFILTANDLANQDFSYLVAKTIATLYKFKEANF